MSEECQCRLCQVVHPAMDTIKKKVTEQEWEVILGIYRRMEAAETDKAMIKAKIENGEITEVEECLPYLKQ